MTAVPTFCPDDHGGHVSRAEALELLNKMEQHYSQTLYEFQVKAVLSRDSAAIFHNASGAQQALGWCLDLMRRTIIDPQAGRDHLLAISKVLEDHASSLRRIAEEPIK